MEATLTFDGVPLESVSQTKNSSDIDDVDDNVIEFEFTADDVRGLYGMIGRRVSIHIHETTHMLDPTSQRNRLYISEVCTGTVVTPTFFHLHRFRFHLHPSP